MADVTLLVITATMLYPYEDKKEIYASCEKRELSYQAITWGPGICVLFGQGKRRHTP